MQPEDSRELEERVEALESEVSDLKTRISDAEVRIEPPRPTRPRRRPEGAKHE